MCHLQFRKHGHWNPEKQLWQVSLTVWCHDDLLPEARLWWFSWEHLLETQPELAGQLMTWWFHRPRQLSPIRVDNESWLQNISATRWLWFGQGDDQTMTLFQIGASFPRQGYICLSQRCTDNNTTQFNTVIQKMQLGKNLFLHPFCCCTNYVR